MGKKKTYNMEAIYCIKILKALRVIKTWKEGASLYFDLTKQELSPSTLSRKVNEFVLTGTSDKSDEQNVQPLNINPYLFMEYLEKFNVLDLLSNTNEKQDLGVAHRVNSDPNAQIIRTFGITREDMKTKFKIDFEKDDSETIKHKMLEKLGDQFFLLEYLGFNPRYFEVKKYDFGSWTTVVKEENEAGEKFPTLVINEKYNVVIAPRKQPIFYYSPKELFEMLSEFLKNKKITAYDLFEEEMEIKTKLGINNIPGKNEELLMVCPGLELHLGKLGSVVDHEDYSTKQAMWRVKLVTKALIGYQKKYDAGQLLLGIGNDYFNSDTSDDKTTAGTPQNNDTRFKEVYLWGQIGYMRLIETVKQYFDKVIIKGNPGNHDEKSSYSLYVFLYYLYNQMKDEKVEIGMTYEDLRFTTRYVFGDNLIVFSHGKSPEGKSLNDSRLAAAVKYYYPEEAHRAKRIYVFAGHLHQDSQNTFDNVTVIRTAALTGVENWHYSNAYLSNRQGHAFYIIDEKRGLISKEYITLTDEEKTEKIESISRDPKTDINVEMTGALNLSESSIEQELMADKIEKVDAIIDQVNMKRDSKLGNIFNILGLDFDDISVEQLHSLRAVFIDEVEKLDQLDNRKKLIKEYHQI